MQALLLALIVTISAPISSPAEVKATFLKRLERPRVALDVQAKGTSTSADGLVTERLDFASEKKPDGTVERVPLILVRPVTVPGGGSTKRPVVMALHGTGGSKEKMLPWLEDLAKRGIVGVAIDGRYHGERLGTETGTARYNAAIVRAWKTKDGEPMEHPFYYDTCWDLWRTIDYLETRNDIDANRIGVTGTSKGGIETWLGAAVDDRIKVAVPTIAVQSFRWSLDHDKWQARARTIADAHESAARSLGKTRVDREVCETLWNKVIPGILDDYDAPSMLRLFAGRPLLILNGELDPNCPLEGAKIAFESAKNAYHAANADDRLEIDVAIGAAHTVTPAQREKALAWFVKWLKP